MSRTHMHTHRDINNFTHKYVNRGVEGRGGEKRGVREGRNYVEAAFAHHVVRDLRDRRRVSAMVSGGARVAREKGVSVFSTEATAVSL